MWVGNIALVAIKQNPKFRKVKLVLDSIERVKEDFEKKQKKAMKKALKKAEKRGISVEQY